MQIKTNLKKQRTFVTNSEIIMFIKNKTIILNELKGNILLVSLSATILFILNYLYFIPYIALGLIDIILCVLLTSLFNNKYKLLFLLHPIILITSSNFFSHSFLDAGDGGGYYAVITQYVDLDRFEFNIEPFLDVFTPLEFFKYASLGAVPIYIIPNYFFINPTSEIYCILTSKWHSVFR